MKTIVAIRSKVMTGQEKKDTCARIQQHIEDRQLVGKLLEEQPHLTQAQAYAQVFALQLSYRSIDSEKLCRELAQLAGITEENYDAAVRAI